MGEDSTKRGADEDGSGRLRGSGDACESANARGIRRRGLFAAVSTASVTGLALVAALGVSATAADESASDHAASARPAAAARPAASTAADDDDADAPTGPRQDTFLGAFAYSAVQPTAVPAGANDWSCKPSQDHPEPVVLVHGTVENRYDNWARLAPQLKDQGYCVYALNYGGKEGDLLQGMGDIPASARQLSDFVDKVRSATGAGKVDVVGHSQGGMMPRYYIKNLGGADKVAKLVGLAPSNHGTSLDGIFALAKLVPKSGDVIGAACASCAQQVSDSDFIGQLNEGGETDPDVAYTVIATDKDEVVTPYTSAFLKDGPNVTNQKLQDFCPLAVDDHIGVSYSKPAAQLVLNALDPAHAQRPTC